MMFYQDSARSVKKRFQTRSGDSGLVIGLCLWAEISGGADLYQELALIILVVGNGYL